MPQKLGKIIGSAVQRAAANAQAPAALLGQALRTPAPARPSTFKKMERTGAKRAAKRAAIQAAMPER